MSEVESVHELENPVKTQTLTPKQDTAAATKPPSQLCIHTYIHTPHHCYIYIHLHIYHPIIQSVNNIKSSLIIIISSIVKL